MKKSILFLSVCTMILFSGCKNRSDNTKVKTDENGVAILSDSEVEDIVKRSYQYVAMYNVNQKMALAEAGLTTHSKIYCSTK